MYFLPALSPHCFNRIVCAQGIQVWTNNKEKSLSSPPEMYKLQWAAQFAKDT